MKKLSKTNTHKKCLFSQEKINEQLEVATKTSDTILRVKAENQLRLNAKTKYKPGCDVATLNYIITQLQEFNKDRRSYGINTGVEICIDIIQDIIEGVTDGRN